MTSSPGAVKLNPNRVDVFARGPNQELRHTFQERTDLSRPWAQWENLGAQFLEHPSAVAWQGSHRLDVFVKGTSDTLIHKIWTATGGWSGWEDYPVVLAGW